MHGGGYYYAREKRYCSRRCAYDFTAPVGKRRKFSKGYVVVKVSPDTPGTRLRENWMLEHRYVMQQVIGRGLQSHESVHHKNGDRTDNRPENLELWDSRKHPNGVRVTDYHCPGCRCFETTL
jgi:hypothetical protein